VNKQKYEQQVNTESENEHNIIESIDQLENNTIA